MPPPAGVDPCKSRGEQSPRLFSCVKKAQDIAAQTIARFSTYRPKQLRGGLVLRHDMLGEFAGQFGQMVELHLEGADALGQRA